MTAVYELSIGLNDKDTKAQIIPTLQAYHIIENIFHNNGVDNLTVYEAVGIYHHIDGAITKENTLIIKCLELKDEIINQLKTALNQECIMIEILEKNVEFK